MADFAQLLGMLARVALVCLYVLAAACLLQFAEISLQIPAASDAQDLHVGFERFQRAHQGKHACTLGLT